VNVYVFSIIYFW